MLFSIGKYHFGIQIRWVIILELCVSKHVWQHDIKISEKFQNDINDDDESDDSSNDDNGDGYETKVKKICSVYENLIYYEI